MEQNIENLTSPTSSASSGSSPTRPHFRNSISYTDGNEYFLSRDLEKLDDGFMLDLESNKKDKKANTHVLLNNILMSVLLLLAVFCLGLGISGYIGTMNFKKTAPTVGLHNDNYAPHLVMSDYFRHNEQQQVMSTKIRNEINHELENGVEQDKQLTNMNNVIDAKLTKLKSSAESNEDESNLLTEGESIKSKQELLSIFKVSKITLILDDYISDIYEKLLKTISEEPIIFNLKKHPDYELLRSYLISNFDLKDPQFDFPLLFVNSKLVLKGDTMKSLTTSEINEVVHQYL